jgi:hypothetical protein
MPAENLALTAQWTINQYTITFDTKEGSVMPSITLDYGSSITMPPNPTKEGYIFNGYSESIPQTMPAFDLSITAFWIKTSVTTDTNTEMSDVLDAIDPSLIQGKDIEVTIKIEIKQSDDIQIEDITLIETLVSNQLDIKDVGSIYFNIEIILKESGMDDVLLTELSNPITLTIHIPEAHQGYKNYRIVRVHNNTAEVLETTYNEADQTLTFETDRFSTYAIIYDASTGISAGWLWLLLLLIPIGLLIFFFLIYKPKDEEEEEETVEPVEETETVIQLDEVTIPQIDERPKYKAFEKVDDGHYLEITESQEASNRVVEVTTGVLPKLINEDNSFIPLQKEEVKQFRIIHLNLVAFKKMTPGSYTDAGYFVEVDLDNKQVDNYVYTQKRLPPTTTKGHRWIRIDTRKIKSE